MSQSSSSEELSAHTAATPTSSDIPGLRPNPQEYCLIHPPTVSTNSDPLIPLLVDTHEQDSLYGGPTSPTHSMSSDGPVLSRRFFQEHFGRQEDHQNELLTTQTSILQKLDNVASAVDSLTRMMKSQFEHQSTQLDGLTDLIKTQLDHQSAQFELQSAQFTQQSFMLAEILNALKLSR